jgi:hypothetical protein
MANRLAPHPNNLIATNQKVLSSECIRVHDNFMLVQQTIKGLLAEDC